MFCSQCGKENPQNATVCANCGSAMSPEIRPSSSSSKTDWYVVGGICGVMFLMIPILAAILFPVFARARESARKSSCQSNLKEIVTAAVMYQGDYDGMLPSSKLYNGSAAWNPQDFVSFAKSAVPAKKSYPVLLEKYAKSKDIFWCPSDPAGGNTDCVSYYWKAAVDAAWYQGFKKETDFAYPADQILLYEHNGWHWGDEPKGLTDGVSINVAYMDGHVASKRIQNSGYTISENPPEPLPAGGVGEPAWFNLKISGSGSVSSVGRFCDPKTCCDELQ